MWLLMKVEFIEMDVVERLKTGEWGEDGGDLSPLVLRLVLRGRNEGCQNRWTNRGSRR